MDTRGELGKKILDISEDDPILSDKINTQEIKNYCESRNRFTVNKCRNEYAKTYKGRQKDDLVELYKKINIGFHKYCQNESKKCPKRINYLSSWINAKSKIPEYSDPSYKNTENYKNIQSSYDKENEIRKALLKIEKEWAWRPNIFMFHIYRSLSNFTKFLTKMEVYYEDVLKSSVHKRILDQFALLNHGLHKLNEKYSDKPVNDNSHSQVRVPTHTFKYNSEHSLSKNHEPIHTPRSNARLVIIPPEQKESWWPFGGRQSKRNIYASKSKKFKNDRILPSTRFSKRRNKRKHKTVSKRNL
jgi:hypothetical protein